jgi:hypothetical protein
MRRISFSGLSCFTGLSDAVLELKALDSFNRNVAAAGTGRGRNADCFRSKLVRAERTSSSDRSLQASKLKLDLSLQGSYHAPNSRARRPCYGKTLLETDRNVSESLDQPQTANAFNEIESPLWQPLLILIVTYLVITCWNLNLQTIENPDEPRYAVPARIMLRSNSVDDWLVPQFNNADRLKKPVFFYWLIAATGGVAQKLGLEMVTGFRMGPVLMGLLAVVGIYLGCSRSWAFIFSGGKCLARARRFWRRAF